MLQYVIRFFKAPFTNPAKLNETDEKIDALERSMAQTKKSFSADHLALNKKIDDASKQSSTDTQALLKKIEQWGRGENLASNGYSSPSHRR